MVLQMMISPLHKLRKPHIMGFLSGCCEGPRDVVPTVPTRKMPQLEKSSPNQRHCCENWKQKKERRNCDLGIVTTSWMPRLYVTIIIIFILILHRNNQYVYAFLFKSLLEQRNCMGSRMLRRLFLQCPAPPKCLP